jgi:hypothetical protein
MPPDERLSAKHRAETNKTQYQLTKADRSDTTTEIEEINNAQVFNIFLDLRPDANNPHPLQQLRTVQTAPA